MTDALEAPQEGAEEVVQSEETEQVDAASEGTESTEGTLPEAPAEANKAEEEERERKSRSERRREAKERAAQELRESEAKRREAEERLRSIKEAGAKIPAPKESDFNSFEEYQAALSAHHAVRMLDGREAQKLEAEAAAHYAQAEQVRQRQAQEDALNWQAQMAEAKAKYPDFEAVALNDALPISNDLAGFIRGSDVAADVAYYIGKNPEQAARLSGMSPVEMARAFGRLEATVSAPKAKTTSSAPDPIIPVKGAGSSTRDPAKMSIEEYRALRQKGWTPS